MRDSIVKIGDKVKVILDGAVRDLEIVDIPDIDTKKGKISFLSPIAQAILGKKYPNRVMVKTPNGKTIECRLMKPAQPAL